MSQTTDEPTKYSMGQVVRVYVDRAVGLTEEARIVGIWAVDGRVEYCVDVGPFGSQHSWVSQAELPRQ